MIVEPMKYKRICVVGGGNLGLVCSGVLMSGGRRVNMLTGHPSDWSREVRVCDSEGKTYAGRFDRVTSDVAEAVNGVDMVFICVPGYLIAEELQAIKPYLSPDVAVGMVVGSSGFFFRAHEILDASTPLFAFQRVPYISRIVKYGKEGALLGYRPALAVACENVPDTADFCKELAEMFLTPVKLLGSHYEVSLTNSNPILHTSRLYSMWYGRENEIFSERNLFYGDWDDAASELLIAMDREFMTLVEALGIRKGAILPLLEYYESTDAASLTAKIRSIISFQPILSPMIPVDGGWKIDFDSRYFIEDFPCGLKLIKDTAMEFDIETPIIDRVLEWGLSRCGKR